MWYIGVYSLFWNFTDSYFDIQDAKRLFPVLAAGCALGNAIGAGAVSAFARDLDTGDFMMLWAAVAAITAPVLIVLRRRWKPLAESDIEEGEKTPLLAQGKTVIRAFLTSRYTVFLAFTLFVMLLLTNLSEFQYSSILQQDRSEGQLQILLGRLYAVASLINILICLFVFNPLVGRIGVRNTALILPIVYLVAFSLLFLSSGFAAALAAFYAYHTVLTAIEYNNQNLLFNAVSSEVKQLVRTLIEGLCEPFAGLFAGVFLLLATPRLGLTEIAGVGAFLALLLICIVLVLRADYPSAMAANMRRGWLQLGRSKAHRQAGVDGSAIQALILSARAATPGERRRLEGELIAIGDIAVPALVNAVPDRTIGFDNRIVAARALAVIAPAQLAAIRAETVDVQLSSAVLSQNLRDVLCNAPVRTPGLTVLIAYSREIISRSVDLTLTLYGLSGLLPEFELLSASLRSTNPKIRANALETLETGVGGETMRRILPLLRDAPVSAEPPSHEALVKAIVTAFGYVRPVAQASAVQALHELAGPQGLRVLELGRRRTLTELARQTLVQRLALIGSSQSPTVVDRIAALLQDPVLAQGELDAAVQIAEQHPTLLTGRALAEAIEGASDRFAQVALALFRSRAEAAHVS